MKKNLVFASRHHQNLPFILGAMTFLSKRLNGEEELLLATAVDPNLTNEQKLDEQAQRMADLLKARQVAGAGDIVIDRDWALAHLGDGNTVPLLEFFRTGVRPEGYVGEGVTFDLPTWGDPIVLGEDGAEINFVSRALSYSEQILLVGAAPELNADGTVKNIDKALRHIADMDAALLNARVPEGTAPIDGHWLLSQLQLSELNQLAVYLTSGEVPVEAVDPNAEPVAEPIPA
ncbi:hypothetical protein GCM10022631_29540 [Deinococcus rubellus]|uniref:Uncharacterized protein n=1 Tax=Deinococcus rubellus TaxID=1889240 RepID=A0ABY5YGH1_9DEIO|nr:hypothetical protein [Deinococcus rubellus]UWX64199.1 hypothetical protein N0D28_00525 [Deinococcus rubellus]